MTTHHVGPPVMPFDVGRLRQDLNQFRLDLLTDIQIWERRGQLRAAAHAREVLHRVTGLLVRWGERHTA